MPPWQLLLVLLLLCVNVWWLRYVGVLWLVFEVIFKDFFNVAFRIPGSRNGDPSVLLGSASVCASVVALASFWQRQVTKVAPEPYLVCFNTP